MVDGNRTGFYIGPCPRAPESPNERAQTFAARERAATSAHFETLSSGGAGDDQPTRGTYSARLRRSTANSAVLPLRAQKYCEASTSGRGAPVRGGGAP